MEATNASTVQRRLTNTVSRFLACLVLEYSTVVLSPDLLVNLNHDENIATEY